MEFIQRSNEQIVEQLLTDLIPDEKKAITTEPGRFVASRNPHIESVLTKMMNLRPSERLVIDVPSQEYIMLKLQKTLNNRATEPVDPVSRWEGVIEEVKRQAQKKVGPGAVADNTDAYGDALFNGFTAANYENMDENNKRAADAGRVGGVNAAVKYMYESSGMDYARMRSMYG